ncbi:hypothetical protein YDYSY3_59610 [Paenibacillus chitinolyticus]|nr:hypothetical protein YDYSY3_59610 [Paenibacillus chitinolyticus]
MNESRDVNLESHPLNASITMEECESVSGTQIYSGRSPNDQVSRHFAAEQHGAQPAKHCIKFQCSRNTVSEVLNSAKENELTWPLPEDVADVDLQYLLFLEKAQVSSRKILDVEYIHRELEKSGVTLSLLWSEYCEMCQLSREIPLVYSPKSFITKIETILSSLLVYFSLLMKRPRMYRGARFQASIPFSASPTTLNPPPIRSIISTIPLRIQCSSSATNI